MTHVVPEHEIPWDGSDRSVDLPASRRTRVARAQTLADVECVFKRWIRDTDLVPTRALLAAYLANQQPDGDPVWLMLVGGSGVGKTERLTALSTMADVVLESSITGPAALLSGTGRKERAKDASGGVLRKFRDGRGVLILKDFTSIIEMHGEPRAEIMAAFREIFDGRWDRSVGVDGGRTLTWIGRIGLLAGCTTAIDSAHAVLSSMGTRFALVRLRADDDVASSVLDHVGREHVMREQLRDAVRGFLAHPPGTAHPLDAETHARLAALGSYVARARSPVDRDQQGEIRLVLDREAPTRIVKMLAQLWRAGGLLGLDRSGAWEMVRRVGMDSVPKLRLVILHYLTACVTSPNTTEIAEAVEHPSRTTRRALEDLTAHGVVQRFAGGQGVADRWALTSRATDYLDRIEGTLPVLSASIDTPLLETKITNDDKTGKVGGPKTGPKATTPDEDADGVY